MRGLPEARDEHRVELDACVLKRSETAPVALAPASTIINASPAPSAAITPIEEAPSRPSISRIAISMRGTKTSAPRAPEVIAAARKRSPNRRGASGGSPIRLGALRHQA